MAASRAGNMQSLNRRHLSNAAGSGLFDTHLYLAEMERDLLKKIGRDREERCLSEVRQRRIYAAIREAHEEKGYPIELVCKLLHVSRSAYHKWASGKLSRRATENERLADTIEKIHEESPDKGYRRLNDDLRHDHGIHVNDKRVLRICRARDIRSIYRRFQLCFVACPLLFGGVFCIAFSLVLSRYDDG